MPCSVWRSSTGVVPAAGLGRGEPPEVPDDTPVHLGQAPVDMGRSGGRGPVSPAAELGRSRFRSMKASAPALSWNANGRARSARLTGPGPAGRSR